MLKKTFKDAEFVGSKNVPTMLAFDPGTGKFVIGDAARQVANKFRPVIQNVKVAIGETDALFNGTSVSSRGTRAQRLWEVRPEAAADKDRFISTHEALRLFLKSLFAEIGDVPKQLIVGIPAAQNETWQRQYRAHVSEVLAELGHPDPQFFPEPFAVFQYYRHFEKVIPPSGQPLAVLVIDFGGGTFDSCFIETTLEGNLARGGSTSIPLGVKSVMGAGKAIDRALLEIAIQKNESPLLRQDSIDARIASRPWVLLAVEEMKIALAKRMQDATLDQNCSQVVELREFPAAWYHPEAAVVLNLNGEDLKTVIKRQWMAKGGFGPSILGTIDTAKFRGGELRLQHVDRVIIAGGSSGLPFLRELVSKTLAAQVDLRKDDIVVGKNCEMSVAYGIAIEALEERNRSLKTHNAIGPCVFDRLYLYSAPRRREAAIKPKIRLWSKESAERLAPGTLLPGPMRVGNFEVEYLIELPFRPHGSLFYWFSDREDDAEPAANRLNMEQDVLRTPPKASNTFRLKIRFDDERGMIVPEFTFGDRRIEANAFVFGGLRLGSDVREYAGIDFGTSNSYAVKLWGTPKPVESAYPEFTISSTAGQRMRALEERLQSERAAGQLTPQAVQSFAHEIEPDFIFHSIKMEGSTLSRGQTQSLLDGQIHATTAEALEPLNIRSAFQFILENASDVFHQPAGFARELNKLVLKGISDKAGTFRARAVKIAQMDYVPPDPVMLEAFMDKFHVELKAGPRDKSVVQFAAEMHSKLTAIHPFDDGNGRTGRLLMCAILLAHGIPPVIISYTDKARYLDALASSNRGDISDFCNLLAESVAANLEAIAGNRGTVEVKLEAPAPPAPKSWVPSQQLVELMEKRLARVPVDWRERYDAWIASFEALREQFNVMCKGFNELYSKALYRTQLERFDSLSFEKYEALLRRMPASHTWLMALAVRSVEIDQKFVFWFHPASATYQKLGRALKNKSGAPALPNADVTLSISRRVDGTYKSLSSEPIRLREIGYANGDWIFLTVGPKGEGVVAQTPLEQAANEFLQDVVAAYF